MMFFVPLLFLVAQHNEEHRHNAQPNHHDEQKVKDKSLVKKHKREGQLGMVLT
jgi:hypothetical protein